MATWLRLQKKITPHAVPTRQNKNMTWQDGVNFNLMKNKTYSAQRGPSSLPENCAIQGGTWTLPFKARYDEEVLVILNKLTHF